MPCSASVLPRAKAGRGIDFEPQNGLAAVAGVRDSGVGVVVDPLRNWPFVIPAAFAGFVIYDLEVSVPIGSIAWFILADTVQVLIAALGLRYCFDGVPRLNSVLALAKYSFFAVFLAPVAAAFLGANGIGGDYWNGWKICFLSEVLAFVTVTPAVLSWVSEGRSWVRKSRAYRLEAITLIVGLVLVGYVLSPPRKN